MARTPLHAFRLALVILAAVPLACAANPICVVGTAYVPVGSRIVLYGERVWVTIDGSQPSYVSHGFAFGGGGGCQNDDPDCATRVGNAREHSLFELRVDGQLVEPSVFNTREMPVGPEMRDCPEDPDTAWPAVWIFEFPPGFFAPGNHTLEGTWSLSALLECIPCQESIDIVLAQGWWIEGPLLISPGHTESITLTVLYPP